MLFHPSGSKNLSLLSLSGVVLAQLLISGVSCNLSSQEKSRSVNLERFRGESWNGQAEIAIYRGKVLRYGEMREAELVLVTVGEPFRMDELVKSETGKGEVRTALKQNQILRYQTGVYNYSQMNSLFWDLNRGTLLKASMSSQDWCGHTFKDMRREGEDWLLSWNSYWEGEAKGSATIQSGEGVEVLYDELPLLVRTDSFRKLKEISLFPLLASSQVMRPDFDIGHPRRMPAFDPARMETVEREVSFQGKMVRASLVEIHHSAPDRKLLDRFTVDLDDPNRRLIRWERNDGGVLELRELHHSDYWNHNGKGDRFQ